MTAGERLSAFDASFLAAETPTAHMHVGWVALLAAEPGRELPDFKAVRAHIERRLARAPRYRQMLARVPLGVHPPEWVDDQDFAIERHVYPAPGRLADVVAEVMSAPLRRDRPLWEMWICEIPNRREFALVGKAHHCMVDGIAAVELGSLLLDSTADPPSEGDGGWRTGPPLSSLELLGRALSDLVAQQLPLARAPLSALRAPASAASGVTRAALRLGRALAHSLRAAPPSALNPELSSQRRLGWSECPLGDLRAVKRAYGTTINDVMLAAVAGGVRRYLLRRGEQPPALKAMVPVNIRTQSDVLGNRISFVFVDLPSDEPYPLKRLHRTHASMSQRKRDGEPEGTDLVLKAAEHTPPPIQHAITRLVASPRTFNLVVSNIPGPPPLYMLGCRLRSVYPIVPLADRHAVSVGMTTVGEQACFGVYCDPHTLPDPDVLADDICREVGELLALAPSDRRSFTAGRSA